MSMIQILGAKANVRYELRGLSMEIGIVSMDGKLIILFLFLKVVQIT
jgi:hypothetical protein